MKKNLLQEQREKAIVENFAKTFNSIKRIDEQAIDEINIGKGLATLGLAAAMAGSPQKSTAQSVIPPAVQRTASDASPYEISDTELDAGVEILNSYIKNPFTADMWYKKNKKDKEKARFFEEVKKIIDYRVKGGDITNDIILDLGAKFKNSRVAMDFLQRKKEDFTTVNLEENT